MLGSNPDQMQRRVSQWEHRFTGAATRFHAMRTEVERIRVSESGAGGAVEVTVDAQGALTELALTDKIRNMPPGELAAQVMACVRRAQQQLPSRVRRAMEATVGDQQRLIDQVVGVYRERFGTDDHDPSRAAAADGEEYFADRAYLR
jgi:DNA-binding protein YbaB